MLTLDVMRDIELSADPPLIRLFGVFVRANYNFPLTKTRVDVEGAERVPWDRAVIFAMNHTDRFNYLPFFLWALDHDKPPTCAWAKGKYYQNAVIRRLLMAGNQIPVPSRGYLIVADALSVLGRPPAEETYALLRDAIDRRDTDFDRLASRAIRAGVHDEIRELLKRPRDMLGVDFEPERENYVEAQVRLFRAMMGEFLSLNRQALRRGCNLLVFPEGTRSPTLSKGRTGLAQMALRLKLPVVPIGCSGSDRAYPGSNPLSRGGDILYRIGEPLHPDGELAEFQIDEPYQPFTREASQVYGDRFEALTEIVMERINGLLKPEYGRSDTDERLVTGTRRFV